MGAISIVLLVAFVIVCVFLVLLVLVQDQDNSGMGGMLGGGNSAAFGAHSASVLTKATGVFVALFFIVVFALAFANRKSSRSHIDDLSEAAKSMNIQSDAAAGASASDWWKESNKAETPVSEPSEAVPDAVSEEPAAVDASVNGEEAAVSTEPTVPVEAVEATADAAVADVAAPAAADSTVAEPAAEATPAAAN